MTSSKLKYQAIHPGDRTTVDFIANIDFRFCYKLFHKQFRRSIPSATKFSIVDATMPLITVKQYQCSHKTGNTKTEKQIYLTPVKSFV